MSDSTQEKTEQATGKKLQEARDSGQVAYSRELTGALLFLFSLVALKTSGDGVVDATQRLLRQMAALPVEAVFAHDPAVLLGHLIVDLLLVLAPIIAISLAATMVPGFIQAGLSFTLKPLQPNPSRLNPLKGVKKLFSIESVVKLVTSVFKTLLVGIVVWITVSDALPRLMWLAEHELAEDVSTVLEVIFLLAFRVAGGLVVLGAADYAYRRWKHAKDLMMTKQDVKDEAKQAEGDSRIKARIREVQRKLFIQRMKNDVRRADVVVRNPTHFAVALKYERDEHVAPVVVAKGRGVMAKTIIRIAKENGVEIVENRPLARDLYRTVPVGQPIPERLFQAVAEILAYVFKARKGARRTG